MGRKAQGLAFFLACLVASIQAAPSQLEGRIVGVHDGDSITLLDSETRQHKIRLDGIDAPELGQPFGNAAKKHLAGLVFNRQVLADCSKTDLYKRKVCLVLFDGVDAGGELIRAGLAWLFRRYAKELPADRRKHYADLEAQAKTEQRALWADADPVPPWEWRRSSADKGAAGKNVLTDTTGEGSE